MRIFGMECLKMCVVVGLALIAAPGRPAAGAPSPTNAYVLQPHKRSPADPNLDLTSTLTTEFGGFGPDFGSGSGFPSTAAGFGLNDAIDGFGTSAGLLHLSHPYSTTAFGSGFDSIGYPFSESTLNQLQFKASLASGSSPSLPVSIKYSPSVANAGLHQTLITGLPATESVRPTAQRTVSLQQIRPNEQRVQAESFNAAPAPLQQSYSAAVSVPQKQTYAIYAPLQESYPASASVPQRQSYPAAISVPLQQSYPGIASVPLQQSYPTSVFIPRQQSFPATASAPLQQSYPASTYVPQQQSYSAVISVPLPQSYPGTASTAFQQSFVTAESVPQRQSYPATKSVPQQQSYSPSGSIQQQQSYPAAQSVPQPQSYSPSGSVPQQQSYQTSGSVLQQQSYQTSVSVPQQQLYQAALSAPLQQSYPATAENFRISAYQPSASSGSASSLVASQAGSTPDLILELRPPPYTAPASSVDYQKNVNIPSTESSSYPPADSNNKNNIYLGNDFSLLTAPAAGTSGRNQVSNAPNGGQLPGNTNNFLGIGSNAKPDQTPSNTYYTVPLPVPSSSNSASSGAPNYFSIPSISYSLTSTGNSEFAGSTSSPPAAAVPSIGTDRGVPAVVNPTYRDTNSIPSLSFTNSNSISANSYSDSNSIQSSSYTIPSSPVAGNSYSDYKLSTENFYGDSNSISSNSKRESSTVNPN